MKMKFIWAVALAAMAFVSCSKDETNTGSDPNNGNGTSLTTASVQLNQSINTMAAPATAMTPEAKEKTFQDAKLYVFNATKVLEKVVDLDVLNSGADARKTFQITDGTKYFYAAVNFGSAYPAVMVGDAMNTVLSKVITISDIAEATTDDAFWMTNTTEVSQLINAGVTETDAQGGTTAAQNFVKIPVGRASVKVACDFVVADNDADQPSGRLTNVSYRVKNVLSKMYFQPYPAVPAVWSAPNYADAAVNAADYLLMTDNDAAFKATGDATTSCADFFYAMENKNNTPKQGNTTYIAVKGTFTPKTTMDANGANPENGVSGADFWRVTNAAGTTFADGYYRAEPTLAVAEAAAGAGAQVVKYGNGVSYYRLWIADNSQTELEEKYALRRNHFYWISITSVAGAGWNAEPGTDPVEPEDPIETETWMKGEIEILDWTMVNQNGGI